MTARRARLAALACALLLAGCKEALNTGLSESEANEVVALLLRNAIPASRAPDAKGGTMTVSVESARFADAVDLLRAHALPRAHHDTIADVFKGNGLVVSPVEERARMVYALGQELSRTLSDIDGVLTARVQPVLPDNDPLRRDLPPASASVYVRYAPGSHVAELTPQIKMLVANGIAGLSYDKVSVVLVPAEAPQAAGAELPLAMQDVAGIWVYGGSAPWLQAVLAGAGGLAAGAAGLLGWLAWRGRNALLSRGKPGKALIVR